MRKVLKGIFFHDILAPLKQVNSSSCWQFILLLFSQHKNTRQSDRNERKRIAGDNELTVSIPKFFKVTLNRFKGHGYCT